MELEDYRNPHNLNADFEYFKNKRDYMLERFCEAVKSKKSEESLLNKIQSLLRIQKILKLTEDNIVAYNCSKNVKDIEEF